AERGYFSGYDGEYGQVYTVIAGSSHFSPGGTKSIRVIGIILCWIRSSSIICAIVLKGIATTGDRR
ncbi:MAG: hypothetical protein KDK04_10800, partial [Candidatus Competibacteraceae bacterium]|nr:hypothetical protein [Candidatus Competibacteraceae bacterium]